jgi:hypothetical protein
MIARANGGRRLPSPARRGQLAASAIACVQATAGLGLIAAPLLSAADGAQVGIVSVIFMPAGGVGLCVLANRSRLRARRMRSHARALAVVSRALEPLRGDGWSVEGPRRWPSGAHVDHLVRAPDGVLSFVIVCAASPPGEATLHVVQEATSWLGYAGCPHVPVVALWRQGHDVERLDAGVLSVSPDRLASAFRDALGAFRDRRLPAQIEAEEAAARRETPGL